MRPCRAAVALGLCAAASCRAAAPPARPELAPGRIKHYRPLELADDAAAADQAVVLGSDGDHGSTVLVLPAAPRPIVVDAPARAGGEPARFVIVTITLTHGPGGATAPGGAMVARDAGLPSSARPAAPAWQAQVWRAAHAAATALGKDLADVALAVTPAEPIAATSSALLAAGFVAAMLGDSVDAAATLTGEIEPDGTIGAVAGLPEQIAAAVAHGKTRIGYPAGMRVARSTAGRDVDVVELARARGAEAVELAALPDAYRALTGHRLPATLPVAATAMALGPADRERLAAAYAAWQRKLAEEWAAVLQLEQAGRLPTAIATLLRIAHERSERAEAMHRTGELVAAHRDAVAAWLHAAAANQSYAVIGKIAAGDLDGALTALAALDPGDAGARDAVTGLVQRAAATLPGELAVVAAQRAVLRARAERALAQGALDEARRVVAELADKPPGELGSAAVLDAAAAAAVPAVLRALRSAAALMTVPEELALAPDDGIACSCPPDSLARAAVALHAAATATAGDVEAAIVAPLARSAGITHDAARRRIAAAFPEYLLANPAPGPPPDAAADPAPAADEPEPGWLALTGAQTALQAAALLLVRQALGTADLEIASEPAPQVVRAQIAGAERAARAAAHAAAIAAGEIPLQARLAYQRAMLPDDADGPIDVLAALWRATEFSETAVTLARRCGSHPAAP